MRGTGTVAGEFRICFYSSLATYFGCSETDVTATALGYATVHTSVDATLAAGETVKVVMDGFAGTYTPNATGNFTYFSGHLVH